jgi:hypothetical protein
MKTHKFQQIRIRINTPGESVRYSAQTDKQYAHIKALFVSMPEDRLIPGSLLGLKVNNQEVFEDIHEVRMLTSGHQVAPNAKFFVFEERFEAAGSTVEGRMTDGGTPLNADMPGVPVQPQGYPYEAKIYLWLTNER